ncbi:Probable transmembrane protein involved in polysaccharide biosynthesis and/or transport [Flavobacterium psychrophilum]|nr:hypothetical protein FPG3_03055 [Flavobacterium psychrophilum FPG3]MBF2044669.1 oligosaccharide flippase family protein [Flavobacterium psychrophilum]OXB10561.1 hypothetical protein B0A57_08725 [Flavobacterium psychrophilum DSM 3660 = ATCC 49418]SHI07108.1 Probable transmembrane protein involved in polysaccharide biosynthesis and/or transport [Flavobacterium psychrophilum]
MDIVNKNIIANYLGKLWSFVSIFIFIRFYIDILGVQSYAVINFYAVILGLLAFADAGLTATLNRELANDISLQNKSDLVFTFERIYLGISLFVMILVYVLSDYISCNFLNSTEFSRHEISRFIKFIGVGVGLQLFSTLYEGGLMGLQKQVLTNKVRMVWSLFRSGVVVIPLSSYPSLEVYFVWQIVCNLAFLVVLKVLISKCLKTEMTAVFSKEMLRKTWSYALGMMGIAFVSAINIQIDKLATSKLLDLKSFGFYSLATTIAQIPVLVVMPIIVAVFPMFSLLVSTNNIEKKTNNFHKFSFIITLIAAPIMVCIFLYSIPIVKLWTGDSSIAVAINLTVKILIVGSFFLCLQLMPYYIALANGHTKTNIITGVLSLLLVVPLIIYSIKEYGMVGATFPWLIVNILSFFIISVSVLNRFLPNELIKWLKHDIAIPLFVTIFIAVLVYYLTLNLIGKYWFLIDISLISLLSLIVNVLIYNKLNKKYLF